MINDGKNCALVSITGIRPFKRCAYCERNLRNCFGFQFFFIVLGIIGLLLTMFFIQDLPAIVLDFNVLILLLLALLGYVAGQETNEVVVSNHLLRELNDELEKRVAQRTKEIAILNLELQKAIRIKSDFIRSIGHETKTPLTAILGYCDILIGKQAGEINESQLKFLTSIKRNGESLVSLTNSLIELSAIEDKKQSSDEMTSSISKIISEAVAAVEPLALKKNISIKTPSADIISKIEVELERTKQVIINLLSNAIKFSNNGTSISVGVKDQEAKITVSIQDSGYGIKADDLKNIFNLVGADIHTKEAPRIGLSIVKSLVEISGGSVNVESEEGKGSTFSFTIPKKKD